VEFDRARFMYVKTAAGVTLWNRSLSMLANGHRPSAVALHLHEHFGTRLDDSGPHDSDCDQRVLEFFARLPIPSDAIAPPSIFDDPGGQV
jgi:hypothetical protein